MKFLVDAQLPRRLAQEIRALGGDAVHTLDLPAGNRTPDEVVSWMAGAEGRVVVTKDSDFVDSFLLRGEPAKLLFITTGNISNDDLLCLLRTHRNSILSLLGEGAYVELRRRAITLHR